MTDATDANDGTRSVEGEHCDAPTGTLDARDPEARPRRVADGDELDELLDAEDLVLLELYTDGCGICASMEPVLGVVAKTVDATVAELNVTGDAALAERFALTSVPTLVLFRDGEEVGRLADGFVPADEVVDFVESHR